MKLYLDLCVYNRPFDNQGNERIALETSAFIYILEKVEGHKYTLVVSDALIYENNANPDEQRKMRVNSYFQLSREFVSTEDSDIGKVKFLKKLGFTDIDALHIVLAERSNVDFFITCDDDIIKLYKKYNDSIRVKILSILEFVAKEVK
ncbi:MAG: PIN domain-containing protein [Candidatus Brocadia sp.]